MLHTLQLLPQLEEANISYWLSQSHKQLNSVLTLDKKEFIELVGTEDLTDFQFSLMKLLKSSISYKSHFFRISNLLPFPRWMIGTSDLMTYCVISSSAVVSSVHSVMNSVS